MYCNCSQGVTLIRINPGSGRVSNVTTQLELVLVFYSRISRDGVRRWCLGITELEYVVERRAGQRTHHDARHTRSPATSCQKSRGKFGKSQTTSPHIGPFRAMPGNERIHYPRWPWTCRSRAQLQHVYRAPRFVSKQRPGYHVLRVHIVHSTLYNVLYTVYSVES